MDEEIQRFSEDSRLFQLMGRYLCEDGKGGENWQGRVTNLDGTDARSLTRLHGELLAFGWLEIDFEVTAYRATAAGRKAHARAANAG